MAKEKEDAIKVTVLRQVLIEGEPVKVGSEITLPKGTAISLGAMGKVKPSHLLTPADRVAIQNTLSYQASRLDVKLGKSASIARPGGSAPAGGGKTAERAAADLTVAELREALTSNEVAFSPKATRPELIALLEAKMAESKA